MGESYDYLFKLIIIGDAACGKSCLLYRFTDNKFKGESTHTIGVEFGSKTVEVSGKFIKQQIWVCGFRGIHRTDRVRIQQAKSDFVLLQEATIVVLLVVCWCMISLVEKVTIIW
eukprot:TRINITY_DN3158_c0_g1_i5.p1 TRINITY_DN3158_c0_g1~~TRINITY_DN3158_c0_g1_i5.p1  ORF type:complete len:114 (-),score=7.08 TRINITY_DN3158_c0_g1_i5:214-555(-)